MKKTENENTEAFIGEATPAQIEAWKVKHGEIKELEIDNHKCYLRMPDRKIIAAATTLGGDPIKFNEILLNSCWLGGSEEIKTNDSLFLGVGSCLAELVRFKTATIKNL